MLWVQANPQFVIPFVISASITFLYFANKIEVDP